MQFTLTINMDNAAFEGCQQINEVQRILQAVAESIDTLNRFRDGGMVRDIRDINGNKVGTWEVTE
jgi:hypothetical protein